MQNAELKAIFEYLSRDRKLPDSTIFSVIADALATVGKKSFGGRNVRVSIDPRTYAIDAFLSRDVVEVVRNRAYEISLDEARRRDPAAQVGGTLETPVTLASFGRIAIQNFRQVITQRLRAVEREKVYDEYRTRIGHLVTGTIRGFERSDVIVDFGDTEGVLPSRERVQSETYNTGDTINFLLVALNDDRSNGSLLLSRASTDFIRELFRKEVAEIADGSVVIKSVSREPGLRTKIAVWSEDGKIDPVGACVGLRGARVKNIVRELGGEKVDIVRIDHFRGFEAYWEIPGGETTAINGHWVKGPDADLFDSLKGQLGDLPIIAEDLGLITEEVDALRNHCGFPGMRILQFAFGNDERAAEFRPESYPENCVAYTGTHDNDTTVGWFHSQAGEGSTRTQAEIDEERRMILGYLGTDGHEINWDLISLGARSAADTFVTPMQDLLGLGSEARMNTPGRASGNWSWRFAWAQLTDAIRSRLAHVTRATGRLAR